MTPIPDDELDRRLLDADQQLVFNKTRTFGPTTRRLGDRRRRIRRWGSFAGVVVIIGAGLMTWSLFAERLNHFSRNNSLAAARNANEMTLAASQRELAELDAEFRKLGSDVFYVRRFRESLTQRRYSPTDRVMLSAANVEAENRAAYAWLLTVADPADQTAIDDTQRQQLANLMDVFPDTTAAKTAEQLVARN